MGTSCSCVDAVFGDDDDDESINMDPPQPQDQKTDDIEENCFVYSNTNNNISTYTFSFRKSIRTKKPIATISLDEKTANDDIKWAMYIKLNKNNKNKYKDSIAPNGYWHIFNNITQSTDYLEEQRLNESDLEMICQTLHNFNSLYNYDNSYETTFNINNNKYKLIYWNKTHLDLTNTFCILNETEYNKQISQNINVKQEAFETYYMRFEYNPKQHKLQWKWYDNSSKYMQWEYENNVDLYCKLEASYLSNLFENFNPKKIVFKFDFCILPNVESVYEKNVKSTEDNDDIKYIFNVDKIVHSDGETYIKCMKCICYNIVNKESFEFDIQRCINDEDCLVKQAEDKQLKEINSKWEWDGSIENISGCSLNQVQYIMWNYVLPTINHEVLNAIKFQLIEYFTENDFSGQKIKKMKAKKFVFSVRAGLKMKKK
eukprot:427962_1